MFAYDIDADGDTDITSAVRAHEWGLAWYEQRPFITKEPFREHLIMSDRSREVEFGAAFSQPHALAHADINGDGLPDILTGKRIWAHCPNGDIEPNAAPVVYWFELVRDATGRVSCIPHMVEDRSGVSVQISASDVNNDGQIDILTA